MPVRIRKEKNAPSSQQYIPRQGGQMAGRGKGGGLANAILPLIVTLFRKRPKLAIILIVLGVVGYILISRSNSPVSEAMTSLMFGTGLKMDEKIYDEAEVFEPLADNIKNPLPERVSLEKYCPVARELTCRGPWRG
jgi:hypothetical protein